MLGHVGQPLGLVPDDHHALTLPYQHSFRICKNYSVALETFGDEAESGAAGNSSSDPVRGWAGSDKPAFAIATIRSGMRWGPEGSDQTRLLGLSGLSTGQVDPGWHVDQPSDQAKSVGKACGIGIGKLCKTGDVIGVQ